MIINGKYQSNLTKEEQFVFDLPKISILEMRDVLIRNASDSDPLQRDSELSVATRFFRAQKHFFITYHKFDQNKDNCDLTYNEHLEIETEFYKARTCRDELWNLVYRLIRRYMLRGGHVSFGTRSGRVEIIPRFFWAGELDWNSATLAVNDPRLCDKPIKFTEITILSETVTETQLQRLDLIVSKFKDPPAYDRKRDKPGRPRFERITPMIIQFRDTNRFLTSRDATQNLISKELNKESKTPQGRPQTVRVHIDKFLKSERKTWHQVIQEQKERLSLKK